MSTTPVFVFRRDRDTEIKGGFLLAGTVYYARGPGPKAVHKQYIKDIIGQLVNDARSGRLLNSRTAGWPGDRRPRDAVDIYDDATMSDWAEDCLRIPVRVPANDEESS
jgi:hypothetical protein